MEENIYGYKKMKALKIITVLLYLAAVGFILAFVPDLIRSKAEGSNFGYGIGVAVMLILGLYAHIPSALLSLVGTIVSAIRYKRGKVTKGTLLFFVLAIIVIVISAVALIFLVKLFA